MKTDIQEYLADYEVRYIVENAIKESVQKKLKDDLERLVSNATYEVVSEFITKIWNNDPRLEMKLREGVKEQVENGSTIKFNLFRKADAFDRRRGQEDSVGQQIFEQAVRDNGGAIREKVEATVKDLGFDDVKSLVMESVHILWEESNA